MKNHFAIGAVAGASTDICRVKVCRCGSVYLTIGPTTFKLSPEAFESVVTTVNETSSSLRVFVAKPAHEAVN